MKDFQNVLKQFILLVAIGFATGVSAFPSEFSVVPPVSHLDAVEAFQNNKSVFFEEVAVSETLPIFYETDFELVPFGSISAYQKNAAVRISEAVLFQNYVQHKNKLLEAQLFPFHFFW